MKSKIEILLLQPCNFSCDYCISGSNHKQNYIVEDGKKKWIPMPADFETSYDGFPKIVAVDSTTPNEVYEDVFKTGKLTSNQALDPKKLIYYVKKFLPEFDLVISGGEPLLYPGIDKLIKILTETNDVILLTNGSLIQKHPDLLKNPRVFFRIGFHPDFREMDEFYENISFIKQHTDLYVVNYVHHPRHAARKKDIEFVNLLKEWDFRYEVTPFKGEYKGQQYDYHEGVYDENFLSVPYSDIVPSGDKLVPGESFLTMYGDGNVWSCHRKKTQNVNIDKGVFMKYASVNGLECIEGDNCHCDSMRAYRHIEMIKSSAVS